MTKSKNCIFNGTCVNNILKPHHVSIQNVDYLVLKRGIKLKLRFLNLFWGTKIILFEKGLIDTMNRGPRDIYK